MLLRNAAAKWGHERLSELLQSPAMQRLRELWQAELQRSSTRVVEDRVAKIKAIPLAKAIEIAQDPKLSRQLLAWGRHAAEADLRVMRDRLFAASGLDSLRGYLSVFMTRPSRSPEPGAPCQPRVSLGARFDQSARQCACLVHGFV